MAQQVFATPDFLKKIHPSDVGAEVIPDFVKRPHIDLWGRILLEAIRKAKTNQGITHIIVNAPPRHGKTWTFGWAVPCWYLDAYPKDQIILGTHTITHSAKYTRKVRNTIESRPDFFKVRVDKTSRDNKNWQTTEGGGMRAAGVGTAIQGERCSLFLFDDLYKDRKQANSPTYHQTLIDWFSDTARTRLQANAIMVWSTTRWGYNDIVGWLRNKAKADRRADQFITLNFPALAGKTDKWLNRKPGEALWPDMFPRKALLKIKRTVSPQTWHALYQGKPKRSYGKMIKEEYFSYFRAINDPETAPHYKLMYHDGKTRTVFMKDCNFFQYVDTALLEEDQADYTAIVTTAITPQNDMLIVDCQRAHIASDEVWHYIYKHWSAWYPFVKRVFIEHKQSGITAFQTGVRKGIPLFKLEIEGNKVARAMPMQELYQAGKIWHPLQHPNRNIMETELIVFPDGDHDDIFDCIAYGANTLQSDLMWTQNSKFPYYGVRSGQASKTQDLLEVVANHTTDKNPFGITDTGGQSYLKQYRQGRVNC